MACKLTKKEQQDLETAFTYLDKHKEGKIKTEDLPIIFYCLGQNPTQDEINEIQAGYPGDCGHYTLEQVVTLVETVGLKSKDEVLSDLEMAFRAIDADNDGVITKKELEKYMRAVGDPMSPEELTEMMALADKDQDGVINWDEFLTVLSQHIM